MIQSKKKKIILYFIEFIITLIILSYFQELIDISIELFNSENTELIVNGIKIHKLRFFEYLSKINILWIYTIYKCFKVTYLLIKEKEF